MSFDKQGLISYIKPGRRQNARDLCYYLGRIEREFDLEIDTEYDRDRFASLFADIRDESIHARRNDKASYIKLKQMRNALKKYSAFCQSKNRADVSVSRNISVTLSEELERELASVNWKIKDTMIGTVRDDIQLDYILEHNCYYAPAQFITSDDLPIRYIALYEQGIGTEPCIRLFGKVIAEKKIKRAKIGVPQSRDNGNELYYFFKVRYWDILSKPIDLRGTQRGKPLFTNKFLLDNCTQSYQLFSVTCEEEFRLLVLVNDAVKEPDKDVIYRINERYTIIAAEGFITVADSNAEVVDRISLASFSFNPADKFERIKNIVFN